MKTPPLDELPDPPPGETGWPWTEAIDRLPKTMDDGSSWPKISIVTPSYNQGQFIEETIRSVLLQGYPNLEYIVMDGGSTDETVEILERYDPWIDHWVSEPDEGQSDAINKGLRRCSGEIFNWLNADDFLVQGALAKIGWAMGEHDAVVAESWRMDEEQSQYGRTTSFTCDGLIIGHADASGDMFRQQGVWLRTDQVQACGGVDPDIEYAMDQDLYIRYTRRFDDVQFLSSPVAVFRIHGDSKTGQADGHFRESQRRILEKYLQDPEFGSKRDLIRWALDRLEWKQFFIQQLNSDAQKWRRVFRIVKGFLRDPFLRLNRPTLGAVKKVLFE